MNSRQAKTDRDHLILLSIFYYVLGGLHVIGGCVPWIHIGIGIAMLTGKMDMGPNPPPREFGLFFVVFGLAISLLLWTISALEIVTAISLSRHKRYRFCFVTACIICIFMPLGTVLGVFSILVLTRPSVKDLFAGLIFGDSRQMDFEEEIEEEPRRAKLPPPSDEGAIREIGN